jgi:hypothetical protein
VQAIKVFIGNSNTGRKNVTLSLKFYLAFILFIATLLYMMLVLSGLISFGFCNKRHE